ncbi:DUF3575 domain-containing protein [uncultured Dokdonia sp.]|uniref:DUF3575 domain-containing protein n=1 Tax=uncultured Dokdonia sp. TaxID=575653 RepID=UPI00261534F9|nr:DUF3575 domain-containing protein [uncultured Dokdonia sp.]
MKKITVFLFLICTTITFAQEDTDDQPVNLNDINNKKHEFRIDVLESLLLPSIDIGYEYVLSKYSGFGANININLQDEEFDFRQKFAFTPYFRQYFFNKKDYGARGFFAEGLLQYATGDNERLFADDIFNNQEERGTWSKFGVGVAIGQKWVSRNGFVIELSTGVGRYFGDDDDGLSPEIFFRGGVSFGYRF